MHFDDTPAGLISLLSQADLYKQVRWQSYETDDRREPTGKLTEAVCVSSRLREQPDSSNYLAVDAPDNERHQLMIDLDLPAYVVPSTTPGHHHLYVEVKDGIPWRDYAALLRALAACGIIERGYAAASLERRSTTLRLPWIAKEYEWKEGDRMKVKFMKVDAQSNWKPGTEEITSTQQRFDAYQFVNAHPDLMIVTSASQAIDLAPGMTAIVHSTLGSYLIGDNIVDVLDRFQIINYLTWVKIQQANSGPPAPVAPSNRDPF